jgi:anthranilate phosphoribosyltransferase
VIQESIRTLIEGKNLASQEISTSVREIIDGAATPAQIGAFLTALRMKGESVEEIAVFASTLQDYGIRIHPEADGRILDTCGTGGDSIKTFNVSTIAAFVVAGAGAPVAKHGNRSVTSKCGSADLLEKAGFNLNMEPSRVQESIERIGIGFMFAPTFHPALKRVAPIRKELGTRTIFNLLGPIINPVEIKAQLMGVYSLTLTAPVAEVLGRLGRDEAMVVHGLDGIDEISVTGQTRVSWLRDGKVTTRDLVPPDFGVRTQREGSVAVTTLEESVGVARELLVGDPKDGPKLEMVLANASASLVLAGKVSDFQGGREIAFESIASGAALRKLEETVKFSGGDNSKLEEFTKQA